MVKNGSVLCVLVFVYLFECKMDGTKKDIDEKYQQFLALKAIQEGDGKDQDTISSFTWQEIVGEALASAGGDAAFNFLIGCLGFDNSRVVERNRAGLGLRDLGDNRAVEHLLAAILKKENINYNGSLV